ncbi:hypothetical protein CQA53_00160 [Helicobacter didelphidarum]|uniref:Porin n=1 Tax=Helicobacter didelphidarum TaxID=2040648 RepID=A0A3D8ISB3_9HELI|nr:hypothetical protein [Helicobacter didelphidarum]RDU67481.1 hypothetical protein CQA53_00160 [Helicobacter didelphidarum]
MRLFIIFICCSYFMFAQYKTLDSALLNGMKQVDIILYGNYMASSAAGNYTNNLYGSNKQIGNGGYINASVGLGYTTGFYYNLRLAISFRATQALFNPNHFARKDFFPNTGNEVLGDSSIALGETFLEYFDGDTAIKVGRFQPISEWINYLTDGIWFRNGSLRNLVIEALWAYDYGRVSYYEISNFKRLDTTGLFNVGVRYFVDGDQKNYKNSAYVNAFSMFIPSVFTGIGVRAHWASNFHGRVWWIGLDLGFAGSIEDHRNIHAFSNNTFLFDTKIIGGYRNIDVMVGYLANGDSGMGSLGILGVGNGTQAGFSHAFYHNIQPFFVWGGRAIKMGKNAHLIYIASKMSFFENKLNAYIAYGATFFNGSRYYGGNTQNISQNELNAMIEFGITRTLSVIAHISSTHAGRGVPNIFELNGGVRFMF